MDILAVIPARSGSKGLKDKNIRILCGKPLCAYTIEAARNSGIFTEIHFSTDSEKYADIACQYGASVPFLRAAELASDTASTWDAVKAIIRQYRTLDKTFDAVMVLQPTAPFRNAEDIRAAYKAFINKNANAIVSVTEPEHSPFWCAELGKEGQMDLFHAKMNFFVSRQKLPRQYQLNGAIYLAKTDYLLRTPDIYAERCYAYIMPRDHSFDIDDQLDFDLCEFLMKRGNPEA